MNNNTINQSIHYNHRFIHPSTHSPIQSIQFHLFIIDPYHCAKGKGRAKIAWWPSLSEWPPTSHTSHTPLASYFCPLSLSHTHIPADHNYSLSCWTKWWDMACLCISLNNTSLHWKRIYVNHFFLSFTSCQDPSQLYLPFTIMHPSYSNCTRRKHLTRSSIC